MVTVTGPLTVSGAAASLYMSFTTGSTTGVVFKNSLPWAHDFSTTEVVPGDADADTTAKARNIFIGFGAGNFTMTGTGGFARANVGIGHWALNALTIGLNNVAIGRSTLKTCTEGNFNMGVGSGSLRLLTTGSDNVAVGDGVLQAVTTGTGNSGIGNSAGETITTGSNNVFIGYLSDASTNSLTNATAIGALAEVDDSNKVVLGHTTVTLTEARGNFRIYNAATSAFYTQFNPGVQVANLTYTLPTAIVASGLLNTNAGGTLSWSTAATLGVVSGTGTNQRIPVWTGTATQGNSGFAQNAHATSIATLDTTSLVASQSFRFALPDPVGDNILITGVAGPGSIPVMADSFTSIRDASGNFAEGTGVLRYHYNAGTPKFYAQVNTVEFQSSGGVTIDMGNVSGNIDATIAYAAGGPFSITLANPTTNQITLNSPVYCGHAAGSSYALSLGVNGVLTSHVVDAAAAKTFQFKTVHALDPSSTSRFYYSFEDNAGNRLMDMRANGSWEIGGAGATTGFLNVSPSTARTESVGFFMNPTLNTAGNSLFGSTFFTAGGMFASVKVGAGTTAPYSSGGMFASELNEVHATGRTGVLGIFTSPISNATANNSSLTYGEATGVKILGIPGNMNMGTFTNFYGVHVGNSGRAAIGSGTSITNAHGFFISEQTRAAVFNCGGFFATSSINYKAICIGDNNTWIGGHAGSFKMNASSLLIGERDVLPEIDRRVNKTGWAAYVAASNFY